MRAVKGPAVGLGTAAIGHRRSVVHCRDCRDTLRQGLHRGLGRA